MPLTLKAKAEIEMRKFDSQQGVDVMEKTLITLNLPEDFDFAVLNVSRGAGGELYYDAPVFDELIATSLVDEGINLEQTEVIIPALLRCVYQVHVESGGKICVPMECSVAEGEAIEKYDVATVMVGSSLLQ